MTERVVTIPEAIELVLDMVPDRRLAPNNSGTKSGWTKGPWIEAQRKQAKACVENNYTIGDALESPVSVEVLIYWGKSLKAGKVRARIEQDRRFDWDSCTVMVKPMIDGALVDSGILKDDRQIQYGTVKQDIDPGERGYTIIRITNRKSVV